MRPPDDKKLEEPEKAICKGCKQSVWEQEIIDGRCYVCRLKNFRTGYDKDKA